MGVVFVAPSASLMAWFFSRSRRRKGWFQGRWRIRTSRSHNLDFSGFTQIMESTYQRMSEVDSKVRRRMPFCLFQHYNVEIDLARKNGDRTFLREPEAYKITGLDTLPIPGPIATYLSVVTNIVTSANDRLQVNLPQGGTLQCPIVAPFAMPSGSFGGCGANNHDAFECYWSPYISRRMIEQTIVANDAAQNFQPWQAVPKRRASRRKSDAEFSAA